MQLSQKLGILKGRLIIRVGGDDVVYLDNEKFLNKRESKYLLDEIDPCYENFKQFSILSAGIAIISVILSAVCLWYGTTYLTPPNDGGMLFMAIAFFVVALISAVKAFKSRLNVICFKSNDGRQLFNILGNKPSENTAKEFAKSLANRIEKIRYNGDISIDRMSEILRKHVEFLHEQKILNEIEVKSALEKIENRTRPNVVNMATFDNV